jgi:putative serine protease PepD
MSGDNKDGQENVNGSQGEVWGRNDRAQGGQSRDDQGAFRNVEDTAAQQRRWENLSQQNQQNTQDLPGLPGYVGQQGQQDQQEQPGQPGPGGPSGQAVAQKTPHRFSTPVVAALILAVGVGASVVTAGIVKDNNDNSSTTTSFDQQGSGDRENTSNEAQPDPGTVEDVANKVLPSVVSIQTTTSEGQAEGSGSIISNDGMIVTNNHVVTGAEEQSSGGSGGSGLGGQGQGLNLGGGGQDPKLTVTTNDGRQLEAEVVATDPQTDLAVIKADGADDLQPIAIGDSDSVQVGQSVVAVGSPLGLSSTVTDGIVSAKNRPVQAGGEDGGEGSLIDAIQTDAAINPGNSGGALVNLQGELVGIPSVIASLGGGMGEESGSIGLGFAIPASQAEKTSKQLIDDGKATHPVIGATVNTGSTKVGGEIAEVNDGGPAKEGGLSDGDVVTKVDDRIVDSGEGLIAAIRSHSVGDKVTLTVTDGDGGDEHQIEVTLDESD